MVQKDFRAKATYDKGFSVNEIFKTKSVGVVSGKDKLFISSRKEELIRKLVEEYENCNVNSINRIAFYPFDNKYIYYEPKLIERARVNLTQHIIARDNSIIIIGKQCVSDWRYIFTSKIMSNLNLTGTAGRFGAGYMFPLYLYPETNGQQTIEQLGERKPNLNAEIVIKIAEKLALTFTNETESTEGTFAPVDILDYIYAVLHSPTYRQKYKEFLKIDFPRVPYPKDQKTFWELVKLGQEIREIHLLDSPKVEDYITSYPKDGNNIITTKIAKKDWELFDEQNQLGRIWINEEQYFDNIPLRAWEFYIGGYQPAQKWLKDRKGRGLKVDDILHYQKIIVALSESDRIMKEIDKIEIE